MCGNMSSKARFTFVKRTDAAAVGLYVVYKPINRFVGMLDLMLLQ